MLAIIKLLIGIFVVGIVVVALPILFGVSIIATISAMNFLASVLMVAIFASGLILIFKLFKIIIPKLKTAHKNGVLMSRVFYSLGVLLLFGAPLLGLTVISLTFAMRWYARRKRIVG